MRAIARKVHISDLSDGTFVKSTAEFEPSYIETPKGKISRVSLMGKVSDVMKFENEGELNSIYLIIEDGTGNISCRWFKNDTDKINREIKIGDFVVVIGKIREDDKGRFVVGEVCKSIDKEWKNVREIEIKLIGDKYGL